MKLRTSKTYYLSTKEIQEITGFEITNSWGEYEIFKDGVNMLEDESIDYILDLIKELVLKKITNIIKVVGNHFANKKSSTRISFIE